MLTYSPGRTKTSAGKGKSSLAADSSGARKGIFSVLGAVSPFLAPSVSTDSATGVTFSGAVLNGTVVDAGSSPIVARGFEYGLTDSYGTSLDESLAESYSYAYQWGRNPIANGQFDAPLGVTTDSSGNIYVADRQNNRIQKFNSSGVYQSQFGAYGSGDGELNGPESITTDSAGDLYVADSGNNRIQKFNSSGVYQSQFSSFGNGDGQLSYPLGITTDSSGNIYVADSGNNRIQTFNSSGVYQSQFGSFGDGDGQVNNPKGITTDSSGNIYVADTNNNRIQTFNSSGVYQSQFGSYGNGDGQLDRPNGIITDSTGDLYVVDSYNNRIQKFNSSGVYQSQFGSFGNTDGKVAYPQGIATDSTGNIYVADTNNHRIQKFNSSGVYQSQFGSNSSSSGQFSNPQGITIDSSANIYVADTYNHRIQKFNISGGYQSQFGSFGTGDGQFSQPQDVAVDTSGNLYVADTNNHRIQKFNSSGVYQSQFGSNGSGDGQLVYPQGITTDSSGNIYVADSGNSRIQKFNSSGVYQSQFGSFGHGDGELYGPKGITTDSSGNIYVADTNNQRIQKFNSSGVYQSQFGSNGSGDGQFSSPKGVTTDSSGNIYVADNNSRIQKFNSSGVYQTQIGSYGSGDGRFIYPQGVATDSSGNIYVADTYNGRILRFVQSMHTGSFSANLGGLICNTTYHYRAYATNATETMYGDDSTFTTAACPNPGPPTNLSATILSTSSIEVSWDPPADTGDSPINYYNVSYQKEGDSGWNSQDAYGTSEVLTGLEPSTNYNIKVIALNQNYSSVDSDVITATTGTPGFNLISTCQQLQDIDSKLGDNFELARNIDCSDTINWNGGQGFEPIGDLFTEQGFTGLFAGNNYSISDLYIDKSGEVALAAPFEVAINARFQDLKLVRPVISAEGTELISAAGLVMYRVTNNPTAGSGILNVHITGADLSATGGSGEGGFIGGLVGYSYTEGNSTLDSRNHFEGSINIDALEPSATYAGGLYAMVNKDLRVENSYARADTVATDSSGSPNSVIIAGGLVGLGDFYDDNSQAGIYDSYAAGTISVDTSGQQISYISLGGLIGITDKNQYAQWTISNSFARVSIQNSTDAAMQATGGLIGGNEGDDAAPVYPNNVFDRDLAGTGDCIAPQSGVISGCSSVSGQPGYFYNNSSNAPLNTWDFTGIWATTSTLPVFSRGALTTITAIPASRLVSDGPQASPPITPAPEAGEAAGPIALSTQTLRDFGEQYFPPAEPGLVEQIRRFLRSIPAGVLVVFPYAFFSLLLIGALVLMIEVLLQTRRLHATRLLIARQQAVAKERDTFWHLAANYLRAPITLMVGGIEILHDDKVPGVTKLQALSATLQRKVGAIMESIEQSKSLQDITMPKAERPKRVLGLVRFWVPVAGVAAIVLIVNYVATEYRNISLSFINLGMQLLLFIIAAVLLYWALGAFGLVSSKRKQAEALLKQQTANLDKARSSFMSQAGAELDGDLAKFQATLENLNGTKTPVGAMAIVYEGAHRLRDLIDNFQLLVAAQNKRLGQLSPAGAHTNLVDIVDEALRPLESLIKQKNLTVHMPDLKGISIPGNTMLANQVVSSVLSNAVAFSPKGSAIEVALTPHKDIVRLSVTNQGNVIPADEISHVFSPLTKADGYDGLQLDHDGLGVNLYIDKLIMRHLGGDISVVSTAQRGTVLTMQWPAAVSA
jgi:sugar lactone lactonase YvrE